MSRSNSAGLGRLGVGVQTGSSSSSSTLTEKYRRNGKLQSCESCRKSKLRCDHVVPACGRCVKRGRAGQCFYHPSPLTQQPQRSVPNPYVVWARQHQQSDNRGRPGGFISAGPSPNEGTLGNAPGRRHNRRWNSHLPPRRQSPTTSLPTPNSSTTQASPNVALESIEISESVAREASKNDSSAFSFNSTPTSGVSHVQCQPFHRAASAPPLEYERPPEVRRNTGFQGPTSNFNILTEGLGILEPDPTDLETLEQQQNIVVTSERITQGCKVLSFFKNRSMITRFITRWYDICEAGDTLAISPVMKEWLRQLWLFHSETLSSQDPTKIRKLSERIWRNTLTPLDIDGKTTPKEWIRLGTGLNLRWEVLGQVAVCIGYAVLEAPPTDSIFVENMVSRACLLGKMKEISEECLIFCRYCEVLDDMFIWLVLEHSGLISALQGSRSYATYRTTGEAHSAVVAMGLHQGIKASDSVPFFLAEFRKRSFLKAYLQEIGLATVLGRPPRLSYRYCTVDPPLDLDDTQLMQSGDELATTLATALDDNGYNTSNKLRFQATLRAYVNNVMRREDIIDLALGQYTREEIIDRSKTIERSRDRHIASLPAFIQKLYTEQLDFTNVDQASAIEVMSLGAIRTGTLSNDVLLQRVLIRKTGASSEKLTRAARAVFRDVLQVTNRHDLASFQASYNAYLSGHGLRSAAIVAIELLKQEMLPQYPENPPLPRSQTIQDLSIFAARLAAVDPSDGCYNLCEQGNKVISKILDRILSPQGARQNSGPVCNHDLSQIQNSNNVDGQAQGLVQGQTDMEVPVSCVGPPLSPILMAMPSDISGYGMMMDLGPIAAPTSLGQDVDFMRWLEGMNWETMDNWSM